MKAYLVLALLAACLILVAGCTQSQAPAQQPATAAATPADQVTATYTYALATTATPTPASVSDNTITIQNMAFSPDTITVKAGSIVRWVNKDSVVHSVVFSKDSKIDPSGALSASQSFSVRFYDAGTFPYSCGIHPEMTGTVIVTQ